MKLLFRSLSLALLIASSCTTEKGPSLEDEIKTIESQLTKSIQVKDAPIEYFSIEERMAHYKVPGMTMAIVRSGKLQWAKAYGIADIRDSMKVDVNTMFQAGSISKPVAALAALHLMEENKVDLDTDVNKYLTDWKVEENEFTATEKVTLRRLLTHTAGMTVHGFPGYKPIDSFPRITDVLNGKGNTPRVFVDTIPGSIWRYSGGGYTVMEKVVEDITSEPLEVYMQPHFLMKMNMDRSTFAQPLPVENQLNVSLAYDVNGEVIEGLWSNYPEQAAAGLWTTPSDLAKYYIEIFDILKGKEDGVLSKSTVEMMLTKHKNDWGLGPSLGGEGDGFYFGHGGKNEGFSNDMTGFPKTGDAIIVMTSADLGMGLVREIFRSASEYYNWEIAEPKIVELADSGTVNLDEIIGTYVYEEEVPEIGKYYVYLQKDGDKIMINDPNTGEIERMSAQDALNFIDLDDGDTIKFNLQKENASFVWNDRFNFYRVDTTSLKK